MNDYEKLRAENIERNNARLRTLGLISKIEEKRSNDIAWKRNLEIVDDVGTENEENRRTIDESDDDDEEWIDIRKPVGDSQRKRRRIYNKNDSSQQSSPQRRSLRVQGKAPDGRALDMQEKKRKRTSEEIQQERESIIQECREARQRAAIEVAKAGVSKAGKENPTATYEHCLMRVRTMTKPKLENRIKAIERAAGKHCVVKMAIFKSCLQDEGMWDLATKANESLERLKALQPPPLSTK